MANDTFNIKGIEFDVQFQIDKEIESGDVCVEIELITIDGVDVTDIIAENWINLIQHEIYVRSFCSRSDRAAFFA